jgi:peptide/nickel transport system substrate-binding protein
LRRAVAGLSAAACTKVVSTGAGERRNPTTQPHILRYGDLGDVSTLNPAFNSDLILAWMSELTMAYLIRFDHENKPIPDLATEVPTARNGGISADGKTITFHLRKGVKWSDGAPFDADDVVFSTRVILDPKTNVVSRDGWDQIARIDEPDKYTVVYRLKAPYSPFASVYFSTGGSNPAIMPKHLLATTRDINKDPYNALPVGIGPFAYKAWKRGDRVVMVANPGYWRGPPKLKQIEYRITPSRDTLLSELQTGDLDMWPIAARAYYPRLLKIPGVSVVRQASFAFNHIDFNLTHPVLRDPAVRTALRLALDRRTLRDKVSHGLGILQDGVLSPASPFFDPKIRFVDFDIAKANAVLNAAGWKRGPDGIRSKNGLRLSLELVSNAGSPDTDTQIELIREWWKKIGVDFVRKNVDPRLLFAPYTDGGIIQNGKFDLVFFAWFTNPSGDMSGLYSCAQVPPNGQNDLRWCNPTAEPAMQAFKHTYEFASQKRYDDILQEELARDVPTIVIAVPEDLYAYNSDLKGFHPNQVSEFDDFMNVDI